MISNIKVLYHSSIRIEDEKIIYIDPFKIEREYGDADSIFITHSHYNHYSPEDINKIVKKNTIVVCTKDLKDKIENEINCDKNNIIYVEPNKEYKIEDLYFETVRAYNLNKQFHPKENNWVGYIIKIGDIKYYIAGDTDITEDNKKVECDIAFLPVGGTYTMNYKEAAELANIIKPKIAIPIHYGGIVGTREDAEKFIELLNEDVEGKILMI